MQEPRARQTQGHTAGGRNGDPQGHKCKDPTVPAPADPGTSHGLWRLVLVTNHHEHGPGSQPLAGGDSWQLSSLLSSPESLPRTLCHRDHKSQQELGTHRWKGLPDTRSTFLHTDPPAGGRGSRETYMQGCFPSWASLRQPRGPALDPTLTPTQGGTCLGCAERGCLCPAGNTDPKEEPAALALYRGFAIGWEGLPLGSGPEGS